MKNIAMISTAWQFTLPVTVCATSAPCGSAAQGFAVRTAASNAAFATFAAADAVALTGIAVKRDHAVTGKGRPGAIAARAQGSSAWSPPI